MARHKEDSGKAQAEVDRLLEILREMENEKNDKDKKINELERWVETRMLETLHQALPLSLYNSKCLAVLCACGVWLLALDRLSCYCVTEFLNDHVLFFVL